MRDLSEFYIANVLRGSRGSMLKNFETWECSVTAVNFIKFSRSRNGGAATKNTYVKIT